MGRCCSRAAPRTNHQWPECVNFRSLITRSFRATNARDARGVLGRPLSAPQRAPWTRTAAIVTYQRAASGSHRPRCQTQFGTTRVHVRGVSQVAQHYASIDWQVHRETHAHPCDAVDIEILIFDTREVDSTSLSPILMKTCDHYTASPATA